MSELKASNLVKTYKKRKVVNNVSLNVKPGEIVGLLGPNGAGKTTCFYMVVGLIAADSGQITLNDTQLTSLAMHKRARRGIGYLPQEPSIFRKLSVEDNISAILEMRKDLTHKQQKEHLQALLNEFHIDHIRKSIGMSLSGGERRRVEIARALAFEPKFMLLDEPFAGIDPISVIDIKRIIRQLLNRGLGILITDHNVRETLDICHRGYIMSAGQLICDGAPDEILQNQQVRDVYLGKEFKL